MKTMARLSGVKMMDGATAMQPAIAGSGATA
jgi:hypothetical protein